MKTTFILLGFFMGVNMLPAQSIGDATLPDLIPYRKGNLWGYCNRDKKIIIPLHFIYARPFVSDFAEVSIDSVTEAIIDKQGKIVARVGRDTTVWTSQSGIIYVQPYNINTIIKLRERDGEWVQSGKYTIYERFSSGIYVARKGKKVGLIDKYEKIILPFKFRSISPPDEKGFIRIVKRNKRVVFVDSSGKRVLLKIARKYDVGNFHDDLATVSVAKKKNSPIGFINRSGKIVIPLIYKKISIFINGLCEVSDGTKTGFINTKGDTIISFKYGSPVNLKNGYVNYRGLQQSTLYDLNDREILKFEAYDIGYVNDSLIVISKKGSGQMSGLKYGIIDINGKEIWPCAFYSIYTNLYPSLIYVLESWSKQPYYMDFKFNKYYED